MVDATSDPEGQRRVSEPLVLALIGLGIAALLFAGAAIPVLLSRSDDATDPADVATSQPAATEPAATEPAATEPATTEPTSAESTTTTVPVESTTTSTPSPTTTAPVEVTTTSSTTAPTTAPAETVSADTSPVAESRAIVRDGKLFLEGAVPDDASRFEIVELAAQIFGPENVIDGYVVDPRASDPNLGNVQVSDAVLFETDSAVITAEFDTLLNQGLALLTIRPAAEFAFEGHTDSRGSDEYNLALSQARADAVVLWYTDRGIDAARLAGIGRGDTEPIGSNDTSEGRQMNRRIEVSISNLLGDPA